ncbi:MAG: hypothetical protein L0H19_07895, partial [Salinisphaera sp.]|nr:hypothetical protein [Salinisphaera sp.]
GKKAGQVLCERLWSERKTAGGYMPSLPIPEGKSSVDWLDVWNQLGVAGFPASELVNPSVRRTGGVK